MNLEGENWGTAGAGAPSVGGAGNGRVQGWGWSREDKDARLIGFRSPWGGTVAGTYLGKTCLSGRAHYAVGRL